ncbi:hypothetical protein SUGI_0888900 [Cryptomeria japonica]|uniref:uncharacterized protein LOC131050693 n=1 Tax=Cryptomeria japonica TaxID=3369 RepID=UPI002414A0AE|nr:uncharacterized protein LOC131050693 [Cryptomeria japonica]GLJ42884.1 hypothetical protein SUGI_0888900 [Cryptomeria japonica]
MKPILLVILLFTLPFISARKHELSAKIMQLSTDDYHHYNKKVGKYRAVNFNRRMLKEVSYSFMEDDDNDDDIGGRHSYAKKNVGAASPVHMFRHGFSFRSVPSRPNPIQNRYRPGSGC